MVKKLNLFISLILVIAVKGEDVETAVNKILPPGMHHALTTLSLSTRT